MSESIVRRSAVEVAASNLLARKERLENQLARSRRNPKEPHPADLNMRARVMRRFPTQPEAAMDELLRAVGVSFARQIVYAPFIVDFFVRGSRIAIEVDGSMHDPHYDRWRDELLAEMYDITVVRFGATEVVEQRPRVLQRLKTILGATLE